jgi:hypothetical protein
MKYLLDDPRVKRVVDGISNNIQDGIEDFVIENVWGEKV